MNEASICFLVGLVAFFGGFVQSVSGFGNAIICMTFWVRLMPFLHASIIESVTAFFMVVYLAFRLRKSIDFELLAPPIVVSVVFSFFGINTLMSLSESVLQRILGIALLLLATYFIFLSRYVHLKATVMTGMIAGLISGFCGGLFNIGGPPIVAYFLSVTDDKEKYNATLQAYFTLTTFSIFSIHLMKGNVTPQLFPHTISAMVGILLGSVLGFHVFKKMKMKQIKNTVYAFMLVAGCYLTLFANH